jgi:predicted TIM-barrel fold metal-dependent hydrolase
MSGSQETATEALSTPSTKLTARDGLFQAFIPAQSWDSHMHVFEPASLDFPGAPYHPIPSSLTHALRFEASLGLRNIVLVQPSCYGYNNSYLLAALRELGDRHARGVVAFDPYTTSAEDLRRWHRLGVRGARVNLKSVDKTMDGQAFERLLRRYAQLVRPLDWVLQLYIPMALVECLETFAADLGVKICLDHFACPDLSPGSSDSEEAYQIRDPYDIPGFRSVTNLLAQGHTYVKISGSYRISKDPLLRDLAPVARELLRIAGKTRLVFATDWPHTRFNGLKIQPFVQQCLKWCEDDPLLIQRLFQGNAEDLWSLGGTQIASSNL